MKMWEEQRLWVESRPFLHRACVLQEKKSRGMDGELTRHS